MTLMRARVTQRRGRNFSKSRSIVYGKSPKFEAAELHRDVRDGSRPDFCDKKGLPPGAS
jgi:hypothetical protein